MAKIESIFQINKMDCPSEEQLVRMALSDFKKVDLMTVDFDKRQAKIIHEEDSQALFSAIDTLNLDAHLVSDKEINEDSFSSGNQEIQGVILGQVLLINLTFFIIEVLSGYLFKSVGLSADGLDMLADSFVYLLALLSIGKPFKNKKRVAALAGYLQMFLATIGFSQVIFRVINHDYVPNSYGMLFIAILALAANLVSYLFLAKTNQEEVHMKASKIFTSNDIVINLGLIVSTVLVHLLHSPIPDLLIGTIVFAIVLKGAFKILSISK